jgi:hypothetical protein
MIERFAKELHFISRIKSDGTSEPVTGEPETLMERNEVFKLICLSITQRTWIAHGMGVFVVKLKCDA